MYGYKGVFPGLYSTLQFRISLEALLQTVYLWDCERG